MDFSGQSILISGATSGIGRATALAFAHSQGIVHRDIKADTVAGERVRAIADGLTSETASHSETAA